MKTTDTPETDEFYKGEKISDDQIFAQKLERERNTLAQWKAEAITVLGEIDFQTIGNLLDLPVGSNVGVAIEPGIRALLTTNEKLDRIIALLTPRTKSSKEIVVDWNASLPRILTPDPLDCLEQLNDRHKARKGQPDPATLTTIRDVPLQKGDWAVECSNPGHFLKVHSAIFGHYANNPQYSYFRPKTYVEAVDAGELIRPSVVKPQLPPYPPVPSGYSHWEARSPGWRSFDPVKFAFVECGWSEWDVALSVRPTCGGDVKIHYIEAIPFPKFIYFKSDVTEKEWRMPVDGSLGDYRNNPNEDWVSSGNSIAQLKADPLLSLVPNWVDTKEQA